MRKSWVRFIELIILLTSEVLTVPLATGKCQNFTPPIVMGGFDFTILSRSSGIAHSKLNFNRIFHVQEEDGPYLYLTDLRAQHEKTVKISYFTPHDVEDLAYGPCDLRQPQKRCLVIGDVGNNYLNRTKPMQLVFIQDRSQFPHTVDPLGKVTIRYPSGPHHAEGIAMHPNGDIYILTKEVDFKKRKTYSSVLFRVRHQDWRDFPKQTITLEQIGPIDLPYLMYEYGFWGQQATGIDISPDGSSLAVITYKHILEIFVDLSKEELKPAEKMREKFDYRIIKAQRLAQQEAITYLQNDTYNGLIYTTSYHGTSVPLIGIFCADQFKQNQIDLIQKKILNHLTPQIVASSS